MARRRTVATPADLIAVWARTARMMYEAQTVIALRSLGMMGLWPVAGSENRRMVDEKIPALLASGMAATRAALSGQRPDQVMDAAVKPLGLKTRANARRLSARALHKGSR